VRTEAFAQPLGPDLTKSGFSSYVFR